MAEIKKHKAKTKAIVLETLNDLPDADIKPPENVLFICKLNPVTTERDLETIFGVYGSIKRCDLIRDWKTGQSLQYAFVEYETKAACEEAYFKMNNALLDERRIHVDFSQSVSKLWNKFRRGGKMLDANSSDITIGDVGLKKKYNRSDARAIYHEDRDYSQQNIKEKHQNNKETSRIEHPESKFRKPDRIKGEESIKSRNRRRSTSSSAELRQQSRKHKKNKDESKKRKRQSSTSSFSRRSKSSASSLSSSIDKKKKDSKRHRSRSRNRHHNRN